MIIVNRKLLVALILCLLVAACSNQTAPTPQTEFGQPLSNKTEERHKEGEFHRHINPEDATAQIQLVLVPSELVVGPNRFAVGIFDLGGNLVHEAGVHLHFFDLGDPTNPFYESEADAYPLSTESGDVTIFAYEREFSHGGDWAVEVEVTFPDGSEAINGIRFYVVDGSPSIEPGERVPAIHTPTLSDVDQQIEELSSAETPNPAFYVQSLDEAIESGKPTLLLFATPAFCQTRFCGPSYEIFKDLAEQYQDQLNFIHVEVFSGLPNPEANNWEPAPSMVQFGLESEPWIYLIDDNGTVLYRVEGIFTQEEIEHHINEKLDL